MMSDETRVGIAGVTAFLLAFPLAAASGLMIAPLVSLMALIAFPVRPAQWQFRSIPWTAIALGLFLAWVGISFLWSPHDNPEQLPKTLLGVPLYIIFAWRVSRLTGAWKARAESALMFMVLALGLVLFSETMTGGAATESFKISAEDNTEFDAVTVYRLIQSSLGHATAPLVLLAGPAALIAWREGGPVIGGIILTLTLIASFSFGTEVNAAAFLLGALAAGAAAIWPRGAISVLFGFVAGGLLATPFLVTGFVNLLPDGVRESLPLSWVWRLEIWTFAGELIREKMFFGHGLDAARPLSATAELAGYQIERMPLHPHNGALHIWLETGLVGALLLASVIIALGARIAGAPQLSRIQSISVAWTFVSYVSLIFFSYGVWQEWHQGALALAATATMFLGAGRAGR